LALYEMFSTNVTVVNVVLRVNLLFRFVALLDLSGLNGVPHNIVAPLTHLRCHLLTLCTSILYIDLYVDPSASFQSTKSPR